MSNQVSQTGSLSSTLMLETMPSLIRLQAAAHLYGFAAPLPAHARVLGIGKGWEPLLGWASVFSDMRLVLLVETEEELSRAKTQAWSSNCQNVQIRTLAELCDLEGSFDYVIIHRLYSRLPAEAGEQLLQLCNAMLGDGGMACVDYDVHPGGKSLENVLQMVGLHIHDIDDPHEAEKAARSALSYLREGMASGSCTAAMREAVERVETELNAYGIQTLWTPRRGPCHFLEFAAAAEAVGLICLGDIEPLREVPRMFGAEVALNHSLHALGQPPVVRQQYLDFATGRWRRDTLLVKAGDVKAGEVRAGASPDLARLADLQWAANFQRLRGGEPGQENFVDAQGRTLDSKSSVTSAVLDALAWAWPGSISVPALRSAVARALAWQEETSGSLVERILDVLLGLTYRGMVQYSLGTGPYDLVPRRQVRLLPGAAGALVERGAPNTSRHMFNLWGQEVSIRFPESDLETLSALEQNFEDEIRAAAGNATADQGLGTFVEGRFVVQNPLRTRQRRLSQLNWHGLILADARAWEETLTAMLSASDGRGPYWIEYVAALARVSLQTSKQSGIQKKLFQPTPQMQRRLDGLVERMKLKGQYSEVEPLMRQLSTAAPNWVTPLEALSHCLIEMGRAEEALVYLLRALQLKSDSAQTYLILAAALSVLPPRALESIAAARRTLALDPTLVKAYVGLGNAMRGERRFKEAEINFRKALELDPDDMVAAVNLASVLVDMGFSEEAIGVCKTALEKSPMQIGLRSNLFFALNYSLRSAEDIYSEYEEADKRFYSVHRTSWKQHRNSKKLNRRLKIGYVSPDFRNHAVARFLEPLMAHHDHERFHITAYADLMVEDNYTTRFKQYSDTWRDITGWTPDAVAARIREDEIDILVDVAGHTANNRLTVFARKPAPVSMTWLGFVYTTGVKAIDYILLDEEMAPEGSEGLFAETPWRFPEAPFVLRMPQQAEISVSELPALTNGYVRFGTLTRAIRINDDVVTAWAEILKRVPDSKIVVDSGNFSDPWVASRLEGMFSKHGIAANRLELGYHSPPWNLLNGIDIGLDCFPHNSGTTLMEMLYMGLPYVTLRGRPSVGRLGASILRSVRHPEWIADSREEYIEKVVELASDLPRLAQIRVALRDEMKNSPLMDEQGFTLEIERIYQRMFKKWVNDHP